MAEFKDANVRDSVNGYLEAIADSLCGKEETPYKGTHDRYRHSLERIAGHMTGGGGVAANQAASSASTAEGVAADLNALIMKLKDAGVMEGDAVALTFSTVTDSVEGRADRQFNTGKVSSVAEADGVITITLSGKVASLKDFDGGNGWGVHKWLGIGISAGVSPITGLTYNGSALTAEDIAEATQCGLSAGYFVRWVAADLVLKGDETQKSKGKFTLGGSGLKKTTYTLKIVEPS